MVSRELREQDLVEGRPESRYSSSMNCPVCRTYMTDMDEVEVCYFKLPSAETFAGFTPRDGAVEVTCRCGFVWWSHIPLTGPMATRVSDREILVEPKGVVRPVEDVEPEKRCCIYCSRFDERSCTVKAGGLYAVILEKPDEETECSGEFYYPRDRVDSDR